MIAELRRDIGERYYGEKFRKSEEL